MLKIISGLKVTAEEHVPEKSKRLDRAQLNRSLTDRGKKSTNSDKHFSSTLKRRLTDSRTMAM